MEAQPALVDRRLKGLFAWGSAWYEILIEVTDKFSKDDIHQRQSLEVVSHLYRERHMIFKRTTPDPMAHMSPRITRKTRPFLAP
jgi:hypothetical protein